ncbi:AMP-binding protein [Nocardia africana]|uniref:AMP-binding protein n=1 Tax=Nocardia africana TaxID=134964 RepID=A0ABW6NI48_9NOCA
MTLSVASVLAESAIRRPDHPAVIFADRRITYEELWRRARQCSEFLRRSGIEAGDRVAVLAANSPEFPVAYFGALAAGATVVPIGPDSRTPEIRHILTDSEAAMLLCDADLRGVADTAAATTGTAVVTEFLDAGPGPADCVPRAPGDIALMLYTSGTTGRPKGVMLSNLNVTMNLTVSMLSPFDFTADDVLLQPLSLAHTFGQICGMATCFRAGATMVLMPKFGAAAALALARQHRCTTFMGVPSMYQAMLTAAESDGGAPQFDRVFSGGSALPPPVLAAVRRTFGCEVYEGYGLTECSPVVAYNQKAFPVRAGTVGRPIWGVQVAVAAAEVAQRVELLPPGRIGEIVVRGHNVMAGYLNRPEATAEVLVDGWLRTGDIGRIDDGYLTLIDRKKDVVLRGGYTVYPREIEEVLLDHPDVAQVAVIGVPDDFLGQEVCAVVIAAPGAAAGPRLGADIVAWSRNRLAQHKFPRRVVFVDSYPLGPSGKILKRELAAALGADGASQPTGLASDRSR